jgi:succinate dehydrogenase/fumarate reductase flavoprotein subunit
MQVPAMADDEVPVPIVGGGGAGLTASMLLARLDRAWLIGRSRQRRAAVSRAGSP